MPLTISVADSACDARVEQRGDGGAGGGEIGDSWTGRRQAVRRMGWISSAFSPCGNVKQGLILMAEGIVIRGAGPNASLPYKGGT